MKRLFAVILLISLLFSLSAAAYAEDTLNDILHGILNEFDDMFSSGKKDAPPAIDLDVQPSYPKPSATQVPEEPRLEEAPAEEAPAVSDPDFSPIEVDFAGLQERNPDIAAWLYSPGTVISYPVAKTNDNVYYLHKDIDGNYSAYGTLFVDCKNENGFADGNTIIYGHHMNDGRMFAKLVDYKNQSYYDAHPVMYLNTPGGNYRVELFSGYITTADSDAFAINFTSDEENQAFIDKAIEQSTFESNVEVKPGDKLVTFTTCTYEYDDARFIVMGKLVPIH